VKSILWQWRNAFGQTTWHRTWAREASPVGKLAECGKQTSSRC